MSDRSQWKMLHLLYTANTPSVSEEALRRAGIDCYSDTIQVLMDNDIVTVSTALNPQTGAPQREYAPSRTGRAMLRSFVIANRRWPGGDLRVDCAQAFVIMPFSQPWSDAVYQQLIKPAVEGAGLVCVRGDDPVRVGDLTTTIWDAILRAGVILADVSAVNANVFYELGLAHALGKDTFILKQKQQKIPADFGGAHYYEYELDKLATAAALLQGELVQWAAANFVKGVAELYGPGG